MDLPLYGRAQQIFSEIKSDLPEQEAEEIEEFFADLDSAIKNIAPIENVQTFVGGIEHEVDEILGEESEEGGLESYFEGIEHHLAEVKETYANSDSDAALAHATKAYLDSLSTLKKLIDQGYLQVSQPPGMRRVFIKGSSIIRMLDQTIIDR